MMSTSKGGPQHWWMEKWAGSAPKGPQDIPAKHRGLVGPSLLLDCDVTHARGAGIEAGGGCTGVQRLVEGCALQI